MNPHRPQGVLTMKDRNPAASKVVASSAELTDAIDVTCDISDSTDKGVRPDNSGAQDLLFEAMSDAASLATTEFRDSRNHARSKPQEGRFTSSPPADFATLSLVFFVQMYIPDAERQPRPVFWPPLSCRQQIRNHSKLQR